MSVICVSPDEVEMFKEVLDVPESAKTARRSPEQIINEKLHDAHDGHDAIYWKSDGFGFYPLYAKCIIDSHVLHAEGQKTLVAVAGLHDLMLGIRFDRHMAAARGERLEDHNRMVRDAWEEWVSLGQRLGKSLAISRGWTLSKSPFTVARLLGKRQAFGAHDADRMATHYVSHAQYFRYPTKPYKPAAILTHSYEPEENVELYAAAFGLNFERLPVSWWYPRKCVAALLTPQRGSSGQ